MGIAPSPEANLPNISFSGAMLVYAARQIEAGAYSDLSELVLAALCRLMDEDGTVSFNILQQELATAVGRVTEEVDPRELLLHPQE